MNSIGNIAETLLAEKLEREKQAHPKFQIRSAWAEFGARWRWEWFITHTFTEDIHEEAAMKLFNVWKSKLSRAIYGPRWHRKDPYGVQTITAIERTKNDRVHIHATARLVQGQRTYDWQERWLELDKRCGISRILPVDSPEAVVSYITKYVSKDGELFFSENLREREADLQKEFQHRL